MPNTIAVAPSGAEASTTATATPAAILPVIEIVASGFGQSKRGAPVTVAARIRNDGPAEDLVPASITAFDANGVVIAAGDVTLRYLAEGETTGFAHRLTVRGSGTVARADVQISEGRPAGNPPPGALSFSGLTTVTDRTGIEASAVLTSSYINDLTEVRVDALAYDSRGAIVGGGELIKRLVPAGGSVGVLVALDLSGAPARVELYAHLP